MSSQENNEVAPPLCGGRYRLLDVIGSGGMAKVYKAFDKRLEVYRAIKVLSPTYAAHAEIRKRFLAEARTTARLAHPNIVTAHDIGADGDRLFIVMELVEGGSIWDRMRETGPLKPERALEVIASVLPALAMAHEQGVIHRDIKPGNILVARDGTCKLADFGIARVAESENTQTRTGSLLGTPAYMAPEQWNGAKELDGRADLFALAATLYSLLTLQTPQDLHIPESQEEQLRPLPEPIRALIARAVRYRPADRYASAAEMLEAVQATTRRVRDDATGARLFASEEDAHAWASALSASPRSDSFGSRTNTISEADGGRPEPGSAGVSADELLRRSRAQSSLPPRPTPNAGLLRSPDQLISGRKRGAPVTGGQPAVVEIPELVEDRSAFGMPAPLRGPPSAMETATEPLRPPPARAPMVITADSGPRSRPPLAPGLARPPPTSPTLAQAPTVEGAQGKRSSFLVKAVVILLGVAALTGLALLWVSWGDGSGSDGAQHPALTGGEQIGTLPEIPPDVPQGTLIVECRPACAVSIDHVVVGDGRVEVKVRAGRHMIGVGPIGTRVNTTLNVPDGDKVEFCWDMDNRKRCSS